MLTMIAIATVVAILFAFTMAIVKARAELAAHAAEQADKHIPKPTPYVGPTYNTYGREVVSKKR